jgi:SAM-dependent methyltransferase
MLPADVGLFLKSARTDAAIQRQRDTEGPRAAFESAYADSADPWGSASPRYRYQGLKYDKLIALLPQGRIARALDLGCGLGLLSQKLARRADHVLGLDLATAAVEQARGHGAAFANLQFEQGDILDLSPSLDGQFDLVVVADVLYYLAPLDDLVLSALALRIASLLRPGGICLLANHFFFAADPDSKASRNIHRAFSASPGFAVMSEHRRAFFLATLFSGQPQAIQSTIVA